MGGKRSPDPGNETGMIQTKKAGER
uniref:Uncharacterized protein n=1 Tax=Arundo donax TaxID=35708 RepID=A0A0A9AWM9_ARUDO